MLAPLRHALRAAACTATAAVCALTAVPAATATTAQPATTAPTSTIAVGQTLCHVGAVGGTRCGRVLGVNQTVNLGGGNFIYNAIISNACGLPGDIGSPVYTVSNVLVARIVHASGCPGHSAYKRPGT
ncbi:hypothetical protein [Streptomyces sp. NPDC020965]|uniref:hypothetical protein n=1 Tax=Streptomyces sp. NPDC020965 TaxID=3365105 RepID=UPI003795EB77